MGRKADRLPRSAFRPLFDGDVCQFHIWPCASESRNVQEIARVYDGFGDGDSNAVFVTVIDAVKVVLGYSKSPTKKTIYETKNQPINPCS